MVRRQLIVSQTTATISMQTQIPTGMIFDFSIIQIGDDPNGFRSTAGKQ